MKVKSFVSVYFVMRQIKPDSLLSFNIFKGPRFDQFVIYMNNIIIQKYDIPISIRNVKSSLILSLIF